MERNGDTTDEAFAAAKGGDPVARWRALEACRDYLRLVVRRGRLSEAAGVQATSDLVQRTVVDAWGQFSKFRGQSPVQLRAWLRAILVHASLKARRRADARRFVSLPTADIAPATNPSPSQAAQRKSAGEALDAALTGLPERQRTVIHLRLWDRLSFGEIGARLGLTEDAARMLYGRALTKLRQSMKPGHDPG
jgi:RNA polymerase sigma-70 factor (ECF subfamily)